MSLSSFWEDIPDSIHHFRPFPKKGARIRDGPCRRRPGLMFQDKNGVIRNVILGRATVKIERIAGR